MVKNTSKSNQVDARQHPHRNRNSSNRFGDNKLTVENVLNNNNNSSAMSVLTVDNILTSITDTKVKEVISVKTNKILFILKKEEEEKSYLNKCCEKEIGESDK